MTSADDFDVATIDAGEDMSFAAEDVQLHSTFEIEDGCVVIEGVYNHTGDLLVIFPEGAEAAVDDDGEPVVRLPDDSLIEMGTEYPLRSGWRGSVAELYDDAQPECTAGNNDGIYVYGVIAD
ncbi:hypothetical protein ACPYO6_09735 [Georgenia sp. Z1344]|uniref:hypothetical protein n=1 Tax=Georgenia sp. Z1344 TaxID=3416706 RepID=UPI003CE78D5C